MAYLNGIFSGLSSPPLPQGLEFLIYYFSSSHMKIDVCPETLFRRSVRLKQMDRTCWTISKTHSYKLNLARRVELFMNLTH